MAERVLWQGNLTSPQAKRSCQQTQLQLATAGVTRYLLCTQGERPKSRRGAAGSQTATASPLLCKPVPRELRAERYLKNRAAGETRKRKTKRGQKREESKRGKQLVVMASLQQEMTRTTYISDLYVNCKWERHSKEPAVDLMSWVIYMKAQEWHISVSNPATLKHRNTSARGVQWHIYISVPFWSALTFSRRQAWIYLLYLFCQHGCIFQHSN